jgi:hypothetical protein
LLLRVPSVAIEWRAIITNRHRVNVRILAWIELAPLKGGAIAYENGRLPHLFLTLPWRGRVGSRCAKRDVCRGGVLRARLA